MTDRAPDAVSPVVRSLRVATWNVDRPRPRGWKKPPAQKRRMAEVAADIWVLTETHVDHAPSEAHPYSAFSPAYLERRELHERWCAIWSRWPLTVLEHPAPHRRGTVAAVTDTPLGPLIIYGTVIPYANERTFDDGRPAQRWQVHHAEAERQAAEWAQLAADNPEVPLVVAGDFNQDRDGSLIYGTQVGRDRVSAGLRAAGLVCVTDRDAVEAGWLPAGHLIDHICISERLAPAATVTCWDKIDEEGQALSDHPIVAVDLVTR